MHDRLPQKGRCPGSHVLFKFWEKADDVLEKVQDRDAVSMQDYRTELTPMTLKLTFAV